MQFCPKCKSLMIPKASGKKTVVACASCGYVDKKAEAEPVIEKVTRKEEIKIITESDSVLPVTEAKCPECGNGKAQFWMQQTRAGDEPETRFFKCTKCKHLWRDYS